MVEKLALVRAHGGEKGRGDLQCGNYVDSRREREQKKKKFERNKWFPQLFVWKRKLRE